MSELVSKVNMCIADSLSVEESELKPESLLIKDLEADSLDIMDIMFKLEEEFDIKLEKEDFDFLRKIEISKEEAIIDGILTMDAKIKLKQFLPELIVEQELKPVQLGNFLSVSAIVALVTEHTSK